MFDISIIGLILYLFYPIFLISLSIVVTITSETTLQTYFYSSNSHWSLVGISIITSAFFSPYIFTLFTTKPSITIPIVFGVMSAILIFAISAVIDKKELRNGSLSEIISARFGVRIKNFITLLFIISNVVLKLIIILIAGNFLVSQVTGVDAYFTLVFFLVITGLYLIIGGMRAELYVSVIQIALITLIAVIFSVWFFNQESIDLFFNSSISIAQIKETSLFLDFSFGDILASLPIFAVWFWLTEQLVVQKISISNKSNFTTKSLRTAAVMQLVPVFIFLIPIALTASTKGGTEGQFVLTSLFNFEDIPVLLKGGVVFALSAALIISFANVFKSTSSIFALDLYKSFKPEASDRELVLIGRLTIMALLFLTVIIIPISQHLDLIVSVHLYEKFLHLISIMAAVFILAVLSNRISSKSVWAGIAFSSFLIVIRTLAEIFIGNESSFFLFPIFQSPNLLQFSTLVFISTLAVSYLWSLFFDKTETQLEYDINKLKDKIIND